MNLTLFVRQEVGADRAQVAQHVVHKLPGVSVRSFGEWPYPGVAKIAVTLEDLSLLRVWTAERNDIKPKPGDLICYVIPE